MPSALAAIPFPPLDPVAFEVGPLAVRWYGLAYLLAFVTGFWALRRMARRGRLAVAEGSVADLVGWLALGVMLGGRVGWWLFYHRPSGHEPWYEPLAVWRGGMSFHGGLLGVAAALVAWSWRRRADLLNVADGLALVAPVGLFFGRVANFINAELVGRPTEVPWAVVFPGDAVARHPSQLYEAALEGPVLLGILLVASRMTRLARPRGRASRGVLAATFLVSYGAVRFGVEFTRQPDVQLGFIALGWLTMGQLLSAITSAAGLVLLSLARTGPTSAREERTGVGGSGGSRGVLSSRPLP